MTIGSEGNGKTSNQLTLGLGGAYTEESYSGPYAPQNCNGRVYLCDEPPGKGEVWADRIGTERGFYYPDKAHG